jgi:UDP-N-acetyl-2-amino-2-deoxyglucuronate dehydrogenase
MRTRVIGFGIIGCGFISRWHAEAIMKVENARLIGATDISKEARESFAGKYGVKIFDSADDLLSDCDIEAVCICTPSGYHAEFAVKAAKAGKHIVVEKPMAITLGECDAIIDACKKNNVKLTVISQLRFSEALIKLKHAVDNGSLGKLVMADVYMKFYRPQEYYDKCGWRGTWKMDGGGTLINQGIHGIDLILHIMGSPISVFAHTKTLARKIEAEDTASAVLEFENGALGIIQAATSIYPGSPRRIEINGSKGTIILEENNITQWSIEGEDIPEGVKINRSTISTANDPAAFSIDGHVMQISDIVDAILSDRDPLVDQYEGRKPLEVIMAIYESSRTGKMVNIKNRWT